MRRILYASGGFVTDDAIAEALMDYASVLAIIDSADVVECEGLDDRGVVRRIKMLIGPASQIVAMEADGGPVEMNVEGIVADLKRRARERLPDYSNVGETSPSSVPESDAESTGDSS